jgi:rhodanese-related sulfurtransferase
MVEYIEPNELRALLRDENGTLSDKVTIVDVRDLDYNEGGHIPGALNWPSETWEIESCVDEYLAAYLSSSNTSQIIVFHCMKSQYRGPSCAKIAAERLLAAEGTTTPKVRVLRGGFLAWQRLYEGTEDIESRDQDI